MTKVGEAPPGDGFGNEIERMLMGAPAARQSASGMPAPMSSGIPGNTLDELMAELGMLRGDRGESVDRTLGRSGTGTRNGPRMSTGDGGLLGSGDAPLRPSTPRSSAAAAAAASGQLVLPPAKGAMPPSLAPVSSPSGPAPLGPGRAQSPMSVSLSMRRSVTGAPGALVAPPLVGAVPPSPPLGSAGPPSGVLERQVQLETRLEKMEQREQQLMSLISSLQQQVSTLSRAQQATQQQLTLVTAIPPTASTASAPQQAPASAADARQPSPSRAGGGGLGAAADAASGAAPQPQPQPHVSDEDFIQDDDGDSPGGSPRHRSAARSGGGGAGALQPSPSGRHGGPSPPATGAPAGGGGRPNKLNPPPTTAPDWEVDVSQLRKELGALAANVVRMRDCLITLVPGGPSPLGEEVSAQAAAAAQLKQNLTQIAMDVVSLHKGLTSLKQNTERNHAALEKGINELQLQIQTNSFNMLAAGPPPATPGGMGAGHPNAVAAALAASGGVSGTLEESLRSVFAKPAMRALPTFNTADLGFMPDSGGAAAAAAAFGGMSGGGGGGGGRRDLVPANGGGGGGGLGAALALLNSFEEQAAAEQAEQQKAAIIARQAVSIVDAKVKQVITHVDRHMQIISSDVEERLRMYEQTIIRMAQQIDRVQRVMRELEGSAASRIVVRQGGKEVEDETVVAGLVPRKEPAPAALEPPGPKENLVKMAAMANGRFVPQKEDKKAPAAKVPHGYFRTPP